MKPELAVVCDQLRTLGLEDVARWVEHPEAVRQLLKSGDLFHEGDDNLYWCNGCGAGADDPHQSVPVMRLGVPHGTREHCPVAAAWRALGDPRGLDDIERAHEEALRYLPPDTRLHYAGNIAMAAPGFNTRIFHGDRDPAYPEGRVDLSSDPSRRLRQVELLLGAGRITLTQADLLLASRDIQFAVLRSGT